MALPATDSFTGTNNTQLAVYSSNWTVLQGAFKLSSNAVTPNTAGSYPDNIGVAYWNADTFSNDHYAKALKSGSAANVELGPAVRISSGLNLYCVRWKGNGTQSLFFKFVNGVFTSLGANDNNVNGTWEIRAVGDTITPLLDGGSFPGISEVTDNSLSTGVAGIFASGDSTAAKLDDWEADNLSSPGQNADFYGDADAFSSFDVNISDATQSLLDTSDAEDNYSAAFFRPGVESTQFFTEVYTTSGTLDVSDDVMAINIYRRIGDLFRGLRKGEAIVTLNNWGGKYTPDNENKTYDIRPTFPIQIISTYLSNTSTLFTGKVEALSLNPDPGERDLRITAKDTIKELEDKTITTSLFANIRVNSFIADILDGIDVTVSSIDNITNTIPVAWFADRNALNAIEEIAEAGFYSVYVDGNGVFNFRGRNFELSKGNRISADEFFALDYRKDDSRIFNRIKVGGDRRRITTEVHTLSYIVEPVFVSDGSTKDFFLSYFDFQTREPVPATGLVSPPVASEDVLINETSSGTGADVTNQCSWWLDEFSEAAKCYIYNGAGTDAYITKFQIRGQPARKEPAIERLREVSSSQAVYGVKDFVIDNRFIEDEEFAGDYADYLKQRFDDPEPKLTLTLRNENPEARTLELGDLITVTNSYLGFVTKGFVIKELEHDITVDRSVLHDITLHVERPTVDENTIIFTLNDPIKGVLNGSGQLVF